MKPIIRLGTYVSENGTTVTKDLIRGTRKLVKCVHLPDNSPLKRAGIDGFIKTNGLDDLTVVANDGRRLVKGNANAKSYIQALKESGASIPQFKNTFLKA